ncbi:ATP-dependent nuclease [Photobacterium kishitanii]|uniref:ATP-dependent nuclease n=1 Tax=Photobacterium kishitanii TaxID=318456 RepID=UPI00071AF14C|nr:AAA family ATPase [Photobacterium kishitanii]
MYLNKLNVKGFRCFEENFEINFSSGLNVIVGENGAGKTAIISAIRQLFQDSESGRYSINNDDFFCAFIPNAIAASSFSICAHFSDLDAKEKVAFLPWTGGTEIAKLNIQAENKEIRGRYKRLLWGGASISSQFDAELIDLIQCIYLPPLRDAESKLTNGRQSRLSRLLKAINRKELKKCRKDDQLHPLEEKFKVFNESLATDEELSIKSANTLIAEHLEKAIGIHFGQKTRIQFVESDFTKIVESLTLLFFPNMSSDNQELFRSLSQNSLGYNNLLYIASILAELTLTESDEDEALFKLLLIEEPEAHLHPQLQIRLLNHLKSVAEDNRNVQVIVTSHSTVLASSVESDSIIHLSKTRLPIATPLCLCDLPDNSKQFINRWLDVTKSNLLFASGVILVEGIAEQMLIPAFAKQVLRGETEGNKTLEDKGISTINLNGIYFKHFMRLYCNFKDVDGENDQDGLNIPVRCSGITDLDPPKDSMPYDDNILPGTNPALKFKGTINNSENARLFVSKYKTLEYDLAMEGNNAAVMAQVILTLWPKPKRGNSRVINEFSKIADIDWSARCSEEKSKVAYRILGCIDNDNIGKGIFSQVLADKIIKDDLSISVPEYIKKAILWACSVENIQL